MSENRWYLINEFNKLLLITKKKQKDVNEIEGILNALTNKCLNIVKSSNHEAVVDAFKAFKDCYNKLCFEFNKDIENNDSFFFGRLVSLLDLITSTMLRLKPTNFNILLKKKEFYTIFDTLYKENRITKSALTKKLACSEEEVTKNIIELEEARLIVVYPLGHDQFLSFSQAGKQEWEKIVNDANINNKESITQVFIQDISIEKVEIKEAVDREKGLPSVFLPTSDEPFMVNAYTGSADDWVDVIWGKISREKNH